MLFLHLLQLKLEFFVSVKVLIFLTNLHYIHIEK
jgi:hypothetical protein